MALFSKVMMVAAGCPSLALPLLLLLELISHRFFFPLFFISFFLPLCAFPADFITFDFLLLISQRRSTTFLVNIRYLPYNQGVNLASVRFLLVFLQETKLWELIKLHHKQHLAKSKAAKGYAQAVVDDMHALYPSGSDDYNRIVALIPHISRVHSLVNGKGGVKGKQTLYIRSFLASFNFSLCFLWFLAEFAHVKEAEEAEKQKAEDLASKTQGLNGLGVGAPVLDMTAEHINGWIERFKREHMEIVSSKEPMFKSTISKEVVNKLVSRVNLWMTDHDAKSSISRWEAFRTQLFAAYNATFL
jgi:hypothetical protein